MGMHDELYCDAELPDADVPAGAIFETKAFPHAFLFRYRITKAGRLIDACCRDLECDGYLEFYHYLDRSVGDCSLVVDLGGINKTNGFWLGDPPARGWPGRVVCRDDSTKNSRPSGAAVRPEHFLRNVSG